MSSIKEELHKLYARLQHPKLEAYERKLIQCEIAYLQKEIQDRQYINKKEYA